MLILLAAATAVLSAPPGRVMERQDTWASLADRVAVEVTEVDPIRGFDRLRMEVWRVAETGQTRIEASHPIISTARFRWYRRHGEWELYQRRLSRARTAARALLLEQGFEPVEPSTIDGRPQLAQRPLQVVHLNVPGGLQTALRLGERTVAISRHEAKTVVLDRGRTAAITVGPLTGFAVSFDYRWLIIQEESTSTPHAAAVPWRRVTVRPLAPLLRALGLPAQRVRPPGLTEITVSPLSDNG